MDIYNLPVSEMRLTTKLTNLLMANDIKFVRDLVKCKFMGLIKIKRLGRKSIMEIEQWFNSEGIPWN